MDKEENKRRCHTEEDYIRCPKFANSLARFVSRNTDGVENATIARLLALSEDRVEEIYEEAVVMLRENLE